ncbi:MAG: polysaccharide biosynthesis tyrosine autokinase [Paludibacteraceae bacterium]|nr:polysaccharide biosynthesis tyrosine autokinase [Paludibacteraceae bacterium]MBR6103871.1 polysaccharide biosynthesis tyrosine autokinase [Paludibacteraceae bacterium]
MQETQRNLSRRQSVKPADDSLSLKNIFGIIKSNKWLVGACTALGLCLGAAYLQKTQPSYSRYTTLLVKENGKKGAKGISDQLMDLGLIGNSSKVDNEIEEFKSPYLMYMAIKKLNLHTTYHERKLLRNSDLYTKSPISATFPDAQDANTFSLKVDIKGPTDFALSHFRWTDPETRLPKEKDTVITARAFQCVNTPVGKVIVEPNGNGLTEKDQKRSITIKRDNPNVLADVYANGMKVELVSKMSSVIKLSLTDVSQQRADDLLKALVDIYTFERLEENRLNAETTNKFIDNRLVTLEKELGKIDNNIEGYKSIELVTNVYSEGLGDVTEQKQYNARALEAVTQLEIAKYINECLSDTSMKDQLLPNNAGITDPSLGNLVSNYNEMVIKKRRLVANSSVKHPLVKEMDETLRQLRSSISSTLANIIHTNSMKVETLKTKEAQINKKIARNPQQEKYLQTIGRQQKIKETLYLFLLQKREENELSGNMEVSNIRVITPPRGPQAPVSPQKAKILLISLIAGMGLPTFIIWLLLTLDGTVRSKKDLDGLTLPFLGSVPLTKRIKDNSKQTMPLRIEVEDKNRNGINEAFRVLRTNFSFMAGHDSELILFTSFYPNSGKTFVSANLAMSLALMDKRILMVDMDLRKAELSKNLCDMRKGVTSLLNGDKETLKGCIIKSKLHDNIDILPSGVIPPNPAELLQNERMDSLMSELRGKYDYVFLDCTPLNLVADASIVGKYADLVLFVMREGQFQRDALPDLEELYHSGTFKRMCTILNGSLNTNGVYGQYHRYGSYGSYKSYGNNYGYK